MLGSGGSPLSNSKTPISGPILKITVVVTTRCLNTSKRQNQLTCPVQMWVNCKRFLWDLTVKEKKHFKKPVADVLSTPDTTAFTHVVLRIWKVRFSSLQNEKSRRKSLLVLKKKASNMEEQNTIEQQVSPSLTADAQLWSALSPYEEPLLDEWQQSVDSHPDFAPKWNMLWGTNK